MKTWSGYINGEWFFWNPPTRIDPSLCEEAMLLGAAAYARSKYEGKSEKESHIEAEKAAFTYQYNIKY